MKILCHVGPWCREQFSVIADAFCPEAEVRYVSGYRRLDQTGVVSSYNSHLASPGTPLLTEADLDVIARCRLLRSLNELDAAKHVVSMRRAIRDMLLREKPDVIICETVDHYLHDLLFREAVELGIPAFGMVISFVNGYFRISVRGERWAVRLPDNGEVETVRTKLIDRNYLPGFVRASRKNLTFAYFKAYFSNHLRVVYFWALRHITREMHNFHYWSSSRTTAQMHRHWTPALPLGEPEWRDAIRGSGKPVIFVPLQYFPEATIDYWAEDPAMVNYPIKLIQMLTKLGEQFSVLVKEHPGVWGYRKPSFYRAIKSIPAVTFCPTATTSQECIDLTDAVLVWTGSVGFEAALRGRPVLTTCDPYYASGRRFKRISMETNTTEIVEFVSRTGAESITDEEQRQLVRYMMEGVLPGRFRADGSFSRENPEHVDEARNVGRWLRRVYDSRPTGWPRSSLGETEGQNLASRAR